MAQTGYTPILIYSSTTAAQAPAAGNLINSTLGSELAINITDGKLFYKDNANAIQVIGWKTTPTTAGGTGLTSYTAGDLLYYATGTTLSKLAIGASGRWLGSSGTAPQWNAPAALTKTDDTNVTLTLGGSASTALLNAASLTLGWTGTLATTRGGTGLSSFTANGILYASSTSALATSSSLTWSGTVFTATGGGGAKAKLQDNSLLLLNSGAIASGFISFQRSDGTQKAAIGSYYNVANEGGLEFIGPTGSTNAMLFASGGFSIGNTTDPGAGNLLVNNLAQANGGVFYGGGKSVTCSVLNTWYNVSAYFGIYVFRDGTSGGTAACLFDGSGGAVFLSNNITGLAGQNSGGTLQVRVTSGTTPRIIYWACLSCVNG